MSKVIHTIAGLQSAMDKYSAYAVDKMADEVKKKIDEFIRYYYEEYTSEFYHRTWSFLNSVTRTEVKKNGNGWQATVYIDMSHVYYNGWDMAGTVLQASLGLHGWYHASKVGDARFWDDAMEEIHSPAFINKFAKFLREKGLNVVMK